MVLTVEVAKKGVSTILTNLWVININMCIKEDSVLVYSKDYSMRHRPGDDISDKTQLMVALMQFDINNYKMEQQILKSAALTTAIQDIQSQLVV